MAAVNQTSSVNTARIHCAHRGFTLIELMVVIVIVMLLTGLTISVVQGIKDKQRKMEALKTIKDIYGAAMQYKEALHSFPPDTGSYGTGDSPEMNTDQSSIVKYLGEKVVEYKTGREYGPFLMLIPRYIVPRGNSRLYVDPWGEPYHLDAVHASVNTDEGTRNVGTVTVIGEPYPPGTDQKFRSNDIRIWSDGPDKKHSRGSCVKEGRGTGADEDNITSWAN